MTPTLFPLCLALVLALAACSKKDAEAPAVTAPAPTVTASPSPSPVVVAAPPAVTVASSADLPSECQSYLDKVEACMGKQPGAAAAMRAGIDQTKATWASMGANKAALGSACKSATDAFAQQAAMMKC